MHFTVGNLILSIFVISVSCNLPRDPNMFSEHPPLCEDIYEDMNDRIYRIIQAAKVLGPQKSIGWEDVRYENLLKLKAEYSQNFTGPAEYYKFSFNKSSSEPLLNLTLKINLHKGQNISSLMPENTLLFILPVNYNVTVFHFERDGEIKPPRFVLIQGRRCKYQYNKEENLYENVTCWEEPSLCRGSLDACLDNDDADHLCFDEDTSEGKIILDPANVFEYSTTISRKIFWQSHLTHYILQYGKFLTQVPKINKWSCEEVLDVTNEIFCTILDGGFGFGFGGATLKTLSGYAG